VASFKRILVAAASAALFAAGAAAPAQAQIKSDEMERAYLKGKKNAHFGQSTMREELRCFFHYTVWPLVVATYDKNLAVAHGELSYGYSQLMFHHYAVRWSQHAQGSPGFTETWLAVIDVQEKRNFEKKKELRKLGTELGECAVPLNRVSLPAQDQGRAETYLFRLTDQPYQNEYPKWAKNRQAWDDYATAWRTGNVARAAQITINTHQSGDTSTFHDNEYLVAVKALVAIGETGVLPASAYQRAAFMEPETFAQLAGYDVADFRPRMEPFTATSSRLGSMSAGTAARNTAENLAREKCRNAGGKVFRVNSVPTESYKATETTWRTTYEATAQCEFPPKLK
jgi:hypothetical protein